MPFYETDPKNSVFAPMTGKMLYSDYAQKEAIEQESDYTTSEVWEAAFTSVNTLGSMIADKSLRHAFDERDYEYNAANDLEGYEDYADILIPAKNRAHAAAIKADIDRENEAKAVLAASGAQGFMAGMVAGIFDPAMLLPAGTIMKGARGYNLLQVTGRSAVVGAVGAGIYEGALQATQDTRTAEDAVYTIGAGALAGGVLGGAASRFAKDEYATYLSKLGEDMKVPDNADDVLFEAAKKEAISTVGAAQVEKWTKEDLTLKGALGVEKLKISPLIRLNTSASTVVREISNKMVETPLRLKMQAQGKTAGVAAETAMGLYQRNLAKGFDSVSGSFKKYKKSAGTNQTYDLKEFKNQVAYAMRRNDMHDIPEIQEAAQALRKEVFNPLKNEAIKMGLLPEDVQARFADSYLTRVWSRTKIIGKSAQFRQVMRDWVRKKIDATEPDLEGKEGYIDFAVEEIYQTLTGVEGFKTPSFVTPVRQGMMKEKLLDIEDIYVEEFLENDISVVMDTYIRKMGADVELARVFDSPDMKNEIQSIKNDYAELMKNASPKELTKLDKQMRRDLKDVEMLRDLLRGHYGTADYDSMWARGSMALRDINFMSKLGGVTVSSIPDAAGSIFKHGIARAFGGLMKFPAMSKEARMAAVNDLKEAGIILDRVISGRLETISDVTDPYARQSGVTKYTGYLSNGFSRMTGINHWNDAMKTYAGIVTQNRVVKAVKAQASGKISKTEREYLKYLGLDDNAVSNIAKQIRKHGSVDSGINLSGVSSWDDTAQGIEAARLFNGAIRKEVNSTVITKGVADAPSFMNSWQGKNIMQFKSFLMAAHNRLLIRGLQDRNFAVFSGMITATALGMLSSKIKADIYDAGLDISGSDRPRMNSGDWSAEKWVVEGVDRSGILSLFWEVNNTWEKLGLSGVTQALGEAPASRYQSRDVWGAIGGPSVGTVSDLASGARMAGSMQRGEDIMASDIHALRRIMPYQNLIGIRAVFDILEEAAIEETGAK